MKTIITASALLLVSTKALSASWEDAWQSPDLHTGVYDRPVTLVEPRPSVGDFTISLDDFGRGSPDYSAHDQVVEPSSIGVSEGVATSLDEAYEGSHDHI